MSGSDDAWERVKKSSESLENDKAYELLFAQKKLSKSNIVGKSRQSTLSTVGGEKSRQSALQTIKNKINHPKELPAPNRKDLRRVKRAQIYVRSTLDLHGRRTKEVAGVLEGFIVNAVERGDKVVLVVTGRGTGKVKDAFLDWVRNRGSSYVSSMSVAGRKHGRDGAFYLWIRKK